jgi:hypothetical protein
MQLSHRHHVSPLSALAVLVLGACSDSTRTAEPPALPPMDPTGAAGASASDPVASGGASQGSSGPIPLASALESSASPLAPAPGQNRPLGMTVEQDQPLFSLDVSQPNVTLTAHGLPPGVTLGARLANAGGQRAIELTDSAGRVEMVAEADWNLPAVAALSANGTLLVCWNLLTGPESEEGGMPHPSTGLALYCRSRKDGSYSDAFAVAETGVPCWLKDVKAEEGDGFSILYFRNQSGWLIGPPAEGDGIFRQGFDGTNLAPPVVLE